jgi:epoxyqueuosine reductase QueG
MAVWKDSHIHMRSWITEFIRREVEEYHPDIHREPLVGFADADHPGFRMLRQKVRPSHHLPTELLEGARTVVVFFIPFSREVVCSNRMDIQVSRKWAEAYIETNRLIKRISIGLTSKLGEMGVGCRWIPPTHDFDPRRLVSRWSHKHVAYLCGLGSFGINQQLITPSGCAGRLGSLVLEMDLNHLPAGPMHEDLCLHKKGIQCLECVSSCPVDALTHDGMDKSRCYRWLLEVDRRFSDLPVTDVCGKCSVQRCAILEDDMPAQRGT